MKLNTYFILSLVFIIQVFTWGCSTKSSVQVTQKSKLDSVAQGYFQTFADRKDWEKLCSFYSEEVEFQDVMLQLALDSLWQFKRFYKWDDEGEAFQKLTPEQDHLTVYSLVTQDSIAVARGRFNPFYYYGNLVDTDWGMDFTIWLYFNKDLQIVKQVDWIEYDPAVLESMIERCKERGFEAVPEWLDLSR